MRRRNRTIPASDVAYPRDGWFEEDPPRMSPVSADPSTESGPKDTSEVRLRVLEPVERISEILFGLIMTLTFTGSLSAADAKRGEAHPLLWAALGCNIAWGIVDGVMYLMACLTARAQASRMARGLRDAETPAHGRRILGAALPSVLADALDPEDLEPLRARLVDSLGIPHKPRLHGEDFLGALAVFLLVTASTFPVVIPFLFISDPMTALRGSNAVAVLMMFFTGWSFGKAADLHPLMMGFCMVLLGLVLVAITIALGG